jgi:hypothetical protein
MKKKLFSKLMAQNLGTKLPNFSKGEQSYSFLIKQDVFGICGVTLTDELPSIYLSIF